MSSFECTCHRYWNFKIKNNEIKEVSYVGDNSDL